MENGLGVTAVIESVAFCSEGIAAFGVVVYFAVINDRASSDRVEHRLGAMSNVNDAETSMTEADITVDKNASVVRPAMVQNVTHCDQCCLSNLFSGFWGECYAVDTAHTVLRNIQWSGNYSFFKKIIGVEGRQPLYTQLEFTGF
jgi:hypothetical protein